MFMDGSWYAFFYSVLLLARKTLDFVLVDRFIQQRDWATVYSKVIMYRRTRVVGLALIGIYLYFSTEDILQSIPPKWRCDENRNFYKQHRCFGMFLMVNELLISFWALWWYHKLCLIVLIWLLAWQKQMKDGFRKWRDPLWPSKSGIILSICFPYFCSKNGRHSVIITSSR